MELSVIKKDHTLFSIIRALIFLMFVSTFLTWLFVGKDLFISFEKYFRGILYGFTVGLVFWLGNWFIGWFMGTKLNWKDNPNKTNLISLFMIFGFGILASVTVPFIYQLLFVGLQANWLNSVLMSGFINLSVDVIFVGFFYTKHLVQYYVQSMISEEELKRENLNARYEALKNQVNPHFLFNSLNTLTGVVEQNPEKAVDFIKKLSDIYRYVLDQRDKEVVAIEEEMRFVENYMHLAKVRYGEGISLKISQNFKGIMVAPLGLQILIENAIKHNIISDDEPLTVEIFKEENYLVVRNNLQKKLASSEKTLVGLENLKNRYQYFTALPVLVSESDGYFTVKLPIIEKPVV
jgi:sensor histidine kinase YesM